MSETWKQPVTDAELELAARIIAQVEVSCLPWARVLGIATAHFLATSNKDDASSFEVRRTP